jgi:hypothetical protein
MRSPCCLCVCVLRGGGGVHKHKDTHFFKSWHHKVWEPLLYEVGYSMEHLHIRNLQAKKDKLQPYFTIKMEGTGSSEMVNSYYCI